jgi:D-alanine transaminase
LVTRRADQAILNGITRVAAIALAQSAQLRIVERPFTVAEAQAAREAFITSTSSWVLPVVSIDGKKIGDGKPGPLAGRLRALYLEHMAGPGRSQ